VESPSVAVLLPVLNEADHIDVCLESLAAQGYPGSLEIVVADGGSVDGTLERLSGWSKRIELKILHNPERVQSAGVNLAAANTDAEVLIRADAHTVYASDYVHRSVELLLTSGATAVGGNQTATARSRFGRAVAAAMDSPLAVGPARFRHADTVEEVDTVYLGAFRRSDFQALGGYRTLPSKVAEDADLYFRWRLQGARVLVDPSIRSKYTPRETPSGLWRQYYRYGIGKADMLYVNRRWPSWRPLGPLLLVLGLLGTLVAAPSNLWPLILLLAAWLVVLAVAGRARPMVMAAAGIMHLAYGTGLLRGLFRRPSKVRAAVTP